MTPGLTLLKRRPRRRGGVSGAARAAPGVQEVEVRDGVCLCKRRTCRSRTPVLSGFRITLVVESAVILDLAKRYRQIRHHQKSDNRYCAHAVGLLWCGQKAGC